MGRGHKSLSTSGATDLDITHAGECEATIRWSESTENDINLWDDVRCAGIEGQYKRVHILVRNTGQMNIVPNASDRLLANAVATIDTGHQLTTNGAATLGQYICLQGFEAGGNQFWDILYVDDTGDWLDGGAP